MIANNSDDENQATNADDEFGEGMEEAVHPIFETRAHWSLFLPSVVVALVYALAWSVLTFGGRGDGALAKIMFLTMMIAPPLLLVQAFLRFNSVGLALTKRHVLVAKGWPHMVGRQIDLKDISAIKYRSSPIGRALGAGKVVLKLSSGKSVSISDLRRPETICDAIRSQITHPVP